MNRGQTDFSDAETRARCLLHIKTGVKEMWNRRAWWFKQTSAVISIDNTGKGNLPANFSSFGKDGSVVNLTTKRALYWRPPNWIMKMRSVNTGTSLRPGYYTLQGHNATGTRYLQVWRTPPSAINLTAYYDKQAPTLTDVDTTSSGLADIPDDFHETVLLYDLISRLQVDEGDSRNVEFRMLARKAEADLWAEHMQGRHQPSGSPRYGQGVIVR